jgi:hypothetical protein
MGSIDMDHRPGLTRDELMKICAKRFEGKYEVYPCRWLWRTIKDAFIVKKSFFSAVVVTVIHTGEKTRIGFGKHWPSVWSYLLFGFLIFFTGRDVVRDVKGFLETSLKADDAR